MGCAESAYATIYSPQQRNRPRSSPFRPSCMFFEKPRKWAPSTEREAEPYSSLTPLSIFKKLSTIKRTILCLNINKPEHSIT